MMCRKWFVGILTLFLIIALAACSSDNGSSSSSNDSSSSENSAANKTSQSSSNDMAKKIGKQDVQNQQKSGSKSQVKSEGQSGKAAKKPTTKHMVIYNAHMAITVHQFDKTQQELQSLVSQFDGYVVQSSTSQTEKDIRKGSMTVRIPQENFQTFLDKVGSVSEKVKHRNINGKDVTKQYVDLKSRLKAKMAVKKRLDTFMKKAKDAKDLLDISNKLADVQEDIEQIKGQMKYLENHSALATVTVTMIEQNHAKISTGHLNTWGKIKNAFAHSINFIVNFASAIAVFIVGYSPVIILVLIVAAIVYLIYRRQKGKISS